MPNIKSQIKRDATNKAANAANSARKSELRTAIKKVEAAVAANDMEAAKAALPLAISLLDKAAQDHIVAKNAANRRKAHLQSIVK